LRRSPEPCPGRLSAVACGTAFEQRRGLKMRAGAERRLPLMLANVLMSAVRNCAELILHSVEKV
jgi:hypothetical protein